MSGFTSETPFKVKASAPGKVILFGEHAVVYGVTAVAAALSDLRIYVEIKSIEEPRIDVCLHDIQVPNDNVPGGMTSFTYSRALRDILLAFHGRPSVVPLGCCRMPVNPDDNILDQLRSLFDASLPAAASQGLMAIMYLSFNILTEYLSLPGSTDGGAGRTGGLSFDVRSVGLPIGAGLGSSAAFSVALSAALLRARQCMIPAEFTDVDDTAIDGDPSIIAIPENLLPVVNGWAYAAEVVIHGSPSGLDNTTSCFGGAVRFRKGEASFTNIPHSDLPEMKILLTNTKVPRSTKLLVAGVRRLHDSLSGVVTPILDSVEAISTRFLEIIAEVRTRKQSHHITDEFAVEKEYLAISQLFRINHDLLSALGVSHPALTIARETSASVRVCVRTSSSKDSEESGLQCKLTGAGGGGCAITLLPPSTVHVSRGEKISGTSTDGSILTTGGSIVDELREKLAKTGFETFESGLAGAGARWHKG